MANCVQCSSFNRILNYCDYHDRDTSPSDWCPQCDLDGTELEGDKRTCGTCDSFDPYTRGGYCDFHKCTTNSCNYCNNWS